jgi:hypothetical protein
MTEQRIEPPSESDIDSIARSLLHAGHVVRELLGAELNGTREDLDLIQKLLDSHTIEREATYTLQALGLAFGRVFIAENRDFDWWMVEDEHGRDAAVRYLKSTLLAYPKTMLSRRIEDGESFDVIELFDQLAARMAQLVDEGYGTG